MSVDFGGWFKKPGGGGGQPVDACGSVGKDYLLLHENGNRSPKNQRRLSNGQRVPVQDEIPGNTVRTYKDGTQDPFPNFKDLNIDGDVNDRNPFGGYPYRYGQSIEDYIRCLPVQKNVPVVLSGIRGGPDTNEYRTFNIREQFIQYFIPGTDDGPKRNAILGVFLQNIAHTFICDDRITDNFYRYITQRFQPVLTLESAEKLANTDTIFHSMRVQGNIGDIELTDTYRYSDLISDIKLVTIIRAGVYSVILHETQQEKTRRDLLIKEYDNNRETTYQALRQLLKSNVERDFWVVMRTHGILPVRFFLCYLKHINFWMDLKRLMRIPLSDDETKPPYKDIMIDNRGDGRWSYNHIVDSQPKGLNNDGLPPSTELLPDNAFDKAFDFFGIDGKVQFARTASNEKLRGEKLDVNNLYYLCYPKRNRYLNNGTEMKKYQELSGVFSRRPYTIYDDRQENHFLHEFGGNGLLSEHSTFLVRTFGKDIKQWVIQRPSLNKIFGFGDTDSIWRGVVPYPYTLLNVTPNGPAEVHVYNPLGGPGVLPIFENPNRIPGLFANDLKLDIHWNGGPGTPPGPVYNKTCVSPGKIIPPKDAVPEIMKNKRKKEDKEEDEAGEPEPAGAAGGGQAEKPDEEDDAAEEARLFAEFKRQRAAEKAAAEKAGPSRPDADP